MTASRVKWQPSEAGQAGRPYDIRPATLNDVAAIAQFQTSCWREAYRGLVPQDYLDRVTVADRAQRWRHRLETGLREVAIGWSGNDVVGVVSWGRLAEAVLELMSLYVAAAHRGTGLADALVDHAIGVAPAQLWVFEGNDRAVAFYSRLGFAPDGSTSLDPDTGLRQLRMSRGDAGCVRPGTGADPGATPSRTWPTPDSSGAQAKFDTHPRNRSTS